MGAPGTGHKPPRAWPDYLDFDIDSIVNPLVPCNPLGSLPRPITHWLGYRHQPHAEPPALIQWPLTFLATVAGLLVVGAVLNTAPAIVALHPPVLVASLGASAVLDYNAIRSPLAQPRNAVLGQTFSAIIGVGISRLFQLAPGFFQQYSWISGAIACGLTSVVMSFTNTVHPPGGATAVLASTDAIIVAMGWRYVPTVLLGSCLMTGVALFMNNTLRQYPVYWWTPQETGAKLRKIKREEKRGREMDEKEAEMEAGKGVERDEEGDLEKQDSSSDRYVCNYVSDLEGHANDLYSEVALRREFKQRVHYRDDIREIIVSSYQMEMPRYIKLEAIEIAALERIQEAIRRHVEVGG